MDFWSSLWNIIYVFFLAFIFISAIYALIIVIGDLFRDKELNGWWKAVWLIFLVFLPLLTTLVYIISRGSGMAERSAKAATRAQEATEDYIRTVASISPAEQIAHAKELLDGGAINAEEFDLLKAKALRS